MGYRPVPYRQLRTDPGHDAVIELYDTDGSVGAAKGAGIGAGVYKDNNEAFATLEKLEVIEPDVAQRTAYDDAYARWKSNLERAMAAF